MNSPASTCAPMPNVALAAIEAFLNRGDLAGAAAEFANLRPSLKSTFDGLKLSARIHSAGNDWEKVGVLCRIIRKEFPAEFFGFEHGARSLHGQGRTLEAIALLKQWNAGAGDAESIQREIARIQGVTGPGA